MCDRTVGGDRECCGEAQRTSCMLSIGPVRDRLKVYRRRYFAPAPYAQKHAVDASGEPEAHTHGSEQPNIHTYIVIDTTHITHDEPSAARRPRRGRAHSSAPRGRRAPSLQSTLSIAAPQGHSGRNRWLAAKGRRRGAAAAARLRTGTSGGPKKTGTPKGRKKTRNTEGEDERNGTPRGT